MSVIRPVVLAVLFGAGVYAFIVMERLNRTRFVNTYRVIRSKSALVCLSTCTREKTCFGVNIRTETTICEFVGRNRNYVDDESWQAYTFKGAAIRFIAAEQSTTYNEFGVASHGIDGNDLTCSLTDIVERDRYWQGEFDVTSTLDYVIIIPYDEYLSYPLGLTLSVCETKEQCAANEGDECAWYPGEFVNATEPLRIYCAHDVTGKYLRLRQKTTIKFYFAFCELSAFSKI